MIYKLNGVSEMDLSNNRVIEFEQDSSGKVTIKIIDDEPCYSQTIVIEKRDFVVLAGFMERGDK